MKQLLGRWLLLGIVLGLPLLAYGGRPTLPEAEVLEYHSRLRHTIGYVAMSIMAFSLVWAVLVLIMDYLKKRKLTQSTISENVSARRAAGMSLTMSDRDRQRAEVRIWFLQGRLCEEGYFMTRTDVLLACKELAVCRKLLITDEELLREVNDLSDAASIGLSRRYVLWDTKIGKFIIVGGLVLSGVLSIYFPYLLFLTLIPLALYFLLGLTPHVVQINPGGLDGTMSGLTLGALGATAASASEIGSYNRTVWVERYSGRKVGEDVDFSPTYAAIMVTMFFLLLTAFFLFIRMEVLFVRNFMLYR